ncbi:hypothetical protein STRPO_1836 [Streptococcus porcinus str. Jelinkova 176]|uniref:Uncharacterized protein n=1 Tax=Streptococcus porcinus str. Jelinkova 176 TaxID=873448 RepID=A0ABN0CV58_STRPO|nr:hypothetical protein STRPO_1836 [Streptococcus porcinus str. Jelinkova 176]
MIVSLFYPKLFKQDSRNKSLSFQWAEQPVLKEGLITSISIIT